MINRDTASAEAASLTDPQNMIAALKRLRNSYQVRPVTGVDLAVLLAVESTLKTAMNAQNRV